MANPFEGLPSVTTIPRSSLGGPNTPPAAANAGGGFRRFLGNLAPVFGGLARPGGAVQAFQALEEKRARQGATSGWEAFQQAMAQTGDPKLAAAQVIRDPQFSQWVAGDPEFLVNVHRAVTTLAGPEESEAVQRAKFAAPGDPAAQREMVASTFGSDLPAKVKEFMFMAGENPEMARQLMFELYKAQLEEARTGQIGTATERAFQRLFERGVIDENMRDLGIAGGLSVQPVTEPGRFGEPETRRWFLVPGVPGLGAVPLGAAPAGPGGPAQVPVEQPASPSRATPGFEDPRFGKASAFLGAGPEAMVRSAVGTILRVADPTRDAGLAESAWRNWLFQLRSQLEDLKTRGRFSEPAFRRLEAAAPYTQTIQSPRDAVVSGVQFRMMLQEGLADAQEAMNRASTRESFQQAADRADAHRGLLRFMPDFEQMEALESALAGGELGGLDIGRTVEEFGAETAGAVKRATADKDLDEARGFIQRGEEIPVELLQRLTPEQIDTLLEEAESGNRP